MAECGGESGLSDTSGSRVTGAPKVNEKDAPPIRLAICSPCRDEVDSEFSLSLARLCSVLGATLVAEGIIDLTILQANGTLVDFSRRKLYWEAVEWGATHILWLDTDMVFPDHLVHSLLKRNVDFVAANYSTRRMPYQPVTYKKTNRDLPGVAPERCFTGPESTGLEEVEATGFGCVLMRVGMGATMKQPLFTTEHDGTGKQWIGEDVNFCLAAREAGFQIWIDHDVSKFVGHAGRLVFTHDHVEMLRDFEAEKNRIIVTPEEVARGL